VTVVVILEIKTRMRDMRKEKEDKVIIIIKMEWGY
jgi:hypothetical protein